MAYQRLLRGDNGGRWHQRLAQRNYRETDDDIGGDLLSINSAARESHSMSYKKLRGVLSW